MPCTHNVLVALDVEESLDDLPALSLLVMDVVEIFFDEGGLDVEEEAGLVILVLTREMIH